MTKHRGQKLEGIRSHGTDMGGDGYIHPRSDKYRENFDKIDWDCPCGDACRCKAGFPEECCGLADE